MSKPIRYVIVTSRGIGEPLKNNLPYNAAMKIKSSFDSRWTNLSSDQPEVVIAENLYPASYGPVPRLDGVSFEESLKAHSNDMDRIFREHSGSTRDSRFILLSYSAGAAGAGDWVNKQTPRTLSQILAMAQVSDPSMPKGIDLRTKVGRECYGVRGSRPIAIAERVIWVYNHSDVINSCPEDSPIRTIAKSTPGIALANRLSWLQVLQRINLMESTARISQGLRWGTPAAEKRKHLEQIEREYRQAFEDAVGYLAGGEHTSYGTRYEPGSPGVTYTEALVRRVTGKMFTEASRLI